jgi:hypothetical protein
MSVGPSAYLLLPDPAFAGATVSASSEGAKFAGPAIPSTSNEGDLVPFQSGTPTSSLGAGIDYRVLRSGGLYEEAQWAWKGTSDPETQWRGVSDKRWLVTPHDPFGDSLDVAYGACVAYSTTYRRVLCFRRPTISVVPQIQVRYRDIDATDPTEWSTTSIAIESLAVTSAAQIAVVELRDGSMRMFVGTLVSGAANDVDEYGSTDGGLTWTRIARNLYDAWSGGTSTKFERLLVDRSGDWIRMVWVNAGGTIKTMVSGDRGATWTVLDDLATAARNNGYTAKWGAIALVGVDDAAGTFLLVVRHTGSNDLTYYVGSRTDEWAASSDLSRVAIATNTVNIVAGRGSTFLWVMLEEEGSGVASWKGYYYRRDHATDDTYTRSMGTFPGYNGSKRYVRAWPSLVETGAGLLLFSALQDPDSAGALVNGGAAEMLMPWTRRSLVATDGFGGSPSALFRDGWSTSYGSPGPSPSEAAGSTSSAWVVFSASGGTMDWTSNRTRVQSTGATSTYYWTLSDGASPVDKWGDGSVFSVVRRGTAGSVATTDTSAARFVAALSTGSTVDVSLRWAGTSFAVFDNIAGATLSTGAGLTNAGWYEWRVAFSYDSPSAFVDVSYAPLGDRAWTSTTGLTLTSGASALTSHQILRIGHLSGDAGGMTSEFRGWWLRADDDLLQFEFSNYSDLNGSSMSPLPTYVYGGISARWGGGSAFEGDVFTGEVSSPYPAEAVLLSAPRVDWRGTLVAGQTDTLTFDADPDYGIGRFVSDGIALFGLRDRVVHAYWATNSAFSPVVAAATISADLYTGLTISAVDGNVLTVAAAGAARFKSGELVGKLVQLEAGSGAFEVVAQYGDRLVSGSTTDLSTLGYSAGSTFVVYGSAGVTLHASRVVARYLRLTFPGVRSTPESEHRLGSIVAGQTFALSVPLDWEHSRKDEPNVEMTTSTAWVNWSYVKSPSRRAITGKIAGDCSEFRQELRDVLASSAEWSNRPLVLVEDDGYPSRTAMLARWSGTYERSEAGWKKVDGSSPDRWVPVGDVAVALVEEI